MQFKAVIFIFLFLSINKAVLAQSFIFNHLQISGNQRTKQEVFLREMGHQFGDQIPKIDSMLGVWQKRFSGLGLFNYVSVNIHSDTLKIGVSELFYTWAKPLLQWGDRNFNVWWQTKDPKRLIYGGTVYYNNIQGLNHSAYLTLIAGYNQLYEAGYKTAFNNHTKGWSWSSKLQYWENHELWYVAKNDKLQFLKLEDKPIQKNVSAEFQLKHRIDYFARMELTSGYNFIQVDTVAWELSYLQNKFGKDNEFYEKIEFVLDTRDQRDYPTSGTMLRCGMKFTWINTAFVANSIFLRYSNFKPLHPNKRIVFAHSWLGSISTGLWNYRNVRQLGYQSDYVRGYEPYVGDGQGFALGKIGLRYAMVQNKVWHASNARLMQNYLKVPISLWFNIFADAGKVMMPLDSYNNPLSGQLYRGFGVGMDLICWYSAMARFEYSFNHLGKAYFNVTFKNAF